eukprot:NODE_22_length_42145_cov_1.310612.p4 type:complete len:601 gc:universal NODE_22_length_42145_cov_1.310612:11882-10080(-)
MDKINELQNWKEHLKSLEEKGQIENYLIKHTLSIPYHLWSQLLKWNLKKHLSKKVLEKLLDYPPLLKLCLFHGTNPNEFDGMRKTTYNRKLIRFFKEMVKHIHLKDSENKSIVVRLAERGSAMDCVFLRALIEQMDIDDDLLVNTDEEGFAPLHYAVLNENVSMVREFVRYTVDLNTVDSNGLSSLHHACILGNREIVDILVDARADMFIKDNEGNTPADVATEGCKDAVEKDPWSKWYNKKGNLSREERKLLMYEKRFAEMSNRSPQYEGDSDMTDTDKLDSVEERNVERTGERPVRGIRKKRGGRRISGPLNDNKQLRKTSKTESPLIASSEKDTFKEKEKDPELKRKRSKDGQTHSSKRLKLVEESDKEIITQIFSSSDIEKQEKAVGHSIIYKDTEVQTGEFQMNSSTQISVETDEKSTSCKFGGKTPEMSIYPIFTFNIPRNNTVFILKSQATSVFEIFGVKYQKIEYIELNDEELEAIKTNQILKQILGDRKIISVINFSGYLIRKANVCRQLIYIHCDLHFEEEAEVQDNLVNLPRDINPFDLIRSAKDTTKNGKEAMKKLLNISRKQDVVQYNQITKLPGQLAFKMLYLKKK